MDKELLFKPRLPEDDVDIPGVGTVRVRGLSRIEVLSARKATDDEHIDGPRALVLERKMLAEAMVDPPMTEAEVGQWQKIAPAGEYVPVVERVQQLSGLTEDAPKSDLPADGDGPGDGVRALPSGEAGPDGGAAAGQPE